MENRKFGAFTSSSDPQEFSKTFESIFKIIGVLIGGYASIKGISFVIPASDAQNLATLLSTVVSASMVVWQAGNTAYGIIRKIASGWGK